jgi:UDP:flavonoid glycosyltransferase YjiC (YdhE family)
LDKHYNILICPLEWGLGHAARMIPVARKLQEMNHNIIVASGEEHLSLFQNEVPGLLYIQFPGFKPGYSRFLPQWAAMFFKIPLLLYHIFREHYRLKKIIDEHAIDIVISDNRFGLWNRKVTTVYVTHMPLIPFPKPFGFLEIIGILIHRSVIKKYSLCFIPDLPGDLNVSGRLSHGIKLPDNVRFIGILSRFNIPHESSEKAQKPFYHNTVILSGPEPQRGILKQKLIAILKDKEAPTVMLEGKPATKNESNRTGNIIFYNNLPSSEMELIITSSESIITRSGYTTIMELISLNCSALLIPTPGQTEQEYLAEYLSEKGWFSTMPQREIRVGISLPSGKSVPPDEIIKQSAVLLTKALSELIEKHHN